jgi:tripartite-type tricarboxylate transporter receptor subunit TctC
MRKIIVILCFIFGITVSLAQDDLSKPITIYVPFAQGGASEQLATIIAKRIQIDTNQSVIVKVNDDSSITPIEFINQVKSKPNDGYHLIVGNLGTHASSVAVNKKTLLYNPLTDFEPIAMLGKTPMYLVVRPNFPANNFQEFINYLQHNSKKKITIGHAGEGSTSYFAGIYFAAILKLDLEFIPYSSSDPALKDLSEGYIDMMIDQTTSSLSYIQSDLVKSLLITSEKPSILTPNTPCAQEVGLHEFNIHGWNMIFMPKGVRKKMQITRNHSIVNALNNKFVQAEMKLLNTLILKPEENTPNHLRDFLQKEINYWEEINTIINLHQ